MITPTLLARMERNFVHMDAGQQQKASEVRRDSNASEFRLEFPATAALGESTASCKQCTYISDRHSQASPEYRLVDLLMCLREIGVVVDVIT
jgi:hypothetical protein